MFMFLYLRLNIGFLYYLISYLSHYTRVQLAINLKNYVLNFYSGRHLYNKITAP
jgi:hypothetical protein